MDFQHIIFVLVLVKVLANKEEPQQSTESPAGVSGDELIKVFGPKVNLTFPLVMPPTNLHPMVGPFRPDMFEFHTTTTTSPAPHTTSGFKPFRMEGPKMDAQELLKSAYKGCISLFEGVIILFTSLFQDGGLLAPNGLLSLLLYPLGAGGTIGQHGILSQLLFWVFRKDGILGANGLLNLLIRGLVGSLRNLESEGLSGIGYSGFK